MYTRACSRTLLHVCTHAHIHAGNELNTDSSKGGGRSRESARYLWLHHRGCVFYVCMCVWFCVRVCMRVCVCVWVRARDSEGQCVYAYVCSSRMYLESADCENKNGLEMGTHLTLLYQSLIRDSFMCVTWLIHLCDMTHSYVRYDSFVCVAWPIHLCVVTHLIVCHDSFICEPLLIHMYGMAHAYLERDFFMCVRQDSLTFMWHA